MHKNAFILFIMILIISIFATICYAAPAPGDYRPDAAFDSHSNRYLLVFHRFENLNFSVFGQFINHNGSALGDPFLIDPNGSNPSVVFDHDNSRFFVTYIKLGFNRNINGQFVNYNGTLEGSSLTISDTSGYMVNTPAVAFDPNSRRFLVVWDFGAIDSDINAQWIKDDMLKHGNNFVISDASNSQYEPHIANDNVNNRFLVVWRDDRNTQYTYKIYGKLLDPNGNVLASDFSISDSSSTTLSPKANFESLNQQYIVVWEDQGGNWEIRGQLLDKDGTSIDANSQPSLTDINISNDTSNEPKKPDIAYGSINQKFLVCWNVDRSSPGDIFGWLLNGNGTPSGNEIAVVDSLSINEYRPSVTYNIRCNNFLIAYERDTGTTNDIQYLILGGQCANGDSSSNSCFIGSVMKGCL